MVHDAVVSDDLEQQRAVRSRLEAILETGHSESVPLVENAASAWVLEPAYGDPREKIASAVEALAATPPFEVDARGVVLHALRLYRAGGAGLYDYLVLFACSERGALPLLTFDHKLSREPGCEAP